MKYGVKNETRPSYKIMKLILKSDKLSESSNKLKLGLWGSSVVSDWTCEFKCLRFESHPSLAEILLFNLFI